MSQFWVWNLFWVLWTDLFCVILIPITEIEKGKMKTALRISAVDHSSDKWYFEYCSTHTFHTEWNELNFKTDNLRLLIGSMFDLFTVENVTGSIHFASADTKNPTTNSLTAIRNLMND